jgi:hypothetical protein
LYHSGKLLDLIEYDVPFGASLDDFRDATQIQALFKKNLDVELGLDPLRTAWKAFIKAELRCREVNEYFGLPSPDPIISRAIRLARERIAAVLGACPSLKRLKPRFGPGASTNIRRADACFENKLGRPFVCSVEMLPAVQSFLEETPSWTMFHGESSGCTRVPEDHSSEWYSSGLSVIVDVGTLTFVDKNAKTHRPIVIEPVLNGFWQLGVGDYIKERLRIHANQDLRDQQRNRDLAKKGSIDGSLATIDLSSASDTIAFSVVFDLLPEDWVNLLSTLRTGHILYDGCQVELEKFSSMGNGYTFELESLIFWGLTSAVAEIHNADQNNISVYGDDIICPVEMVDSLFKILDYCGFWVNPQKSFWSGPFRESCGADWLNGEDVRPIFKKDRLSLQFLYLFHNWALRRGRTDLSSIARSFIPEDFQLFGPDGYGDGHLLGSYDLKKSRISKRSGWEGGYFSTFRETSRTTGIDCSGLHVYALYDLYSRGPTEWWEPRSLRPRGTAPGSKCVERASLYTFAEHIFCR